MDFGYERKQVNKQMWNYVCNSCGATLDPGEKCTCNEDRDERIRLMRQFISQSERIRPSALQRTRKERQIIF